MKILVVHDNSGNIHSVIVMPNRASGDVKFTMKPEPSYQINEVEAPHVRDEEDHEHLSEIRAHYRIEAHSGGYRLVHK